MSFGFQRAILLTAGLFTLSSAGVSAQGDPELGARAFQVCAACHSLEPGRHMTGPSLAGIWDRKAGTIEDFRRYSPALRSAGIVWNEQTLDAWLADPKSSIPGNRMTFAGLKDTRARAGLIAFLKSAGAGGGGGQAAQGGTMGGMMGGGESEDLKKVAASQIVRAIRYCGDTYEVTTADGEMLPYWEFNLRFKTDSGAKGPAKGKPAIMPAGMGGDRASVIFAGPAEISALIEPKCQ